MLYQTYISSPAWRTSAARRAELAASGHRCRICNAGRGTARLEVHHRTYERLGRERVSDLTTLCSDCHRNATEHLRRRRYAGRRTMTVNYQSRGCGGANLNELMKRGGRP